MKNKSILITIILGLFFNCNPQKEDIAEDVVFYYTVSSPSEKATDLVDFLNTSINNKRVAITYQSGYSWPFYQELGPDQRLLVDSIMPPHYFVHLLKERSDKEIEIGQYFVDIKVMTKDTLPNYDITIYTMKPTGLAITGNPGFHLLDPQYYTDSLTLYDTFLKSVVRYSFK